MDRRRLLLLAVTAVPASAHSAAAAPTLSAAGGVLQMLAGLAIVLLLLWAALALLRRLQAARGTQAGLLQVLSAAAVGPRERVVLVRVADQVLVLGVAPGQVVTLSSLPAEALPSLPTGVPGASGARDFAARLSQQLARRGRKGNENA